ncbi:tetratricopeptide repeat protein [Candidatus Sumerlaeota bacterium]|nr:tetratricopeptide repeat protein [Candidatus Sumerlaeota bacterium]
MKRFKKKRVPGNTGTSSENPLSPLRSPRIYLMLLIVGLTFISFSPVLPSGFLWDDDAITDNPLLRSPDGLFKIWFSPSVMSKEAHYWPVAYSIFWIQYRLWDFHPVGYHLVNLFLHIINVLLLWSLFSRIDKKSATFAALLIAVHPVHTEAVAWIIELKDVLSVTLYLAAFLLFVKFHEKPALSFYILSLLAFLAALLTKSMTVTLPGALFLWILAKNRKITLRDIGYLFSFAFIALVIAWSDAHFAQSREIVAFDFSLGERLKIASHAVFFYMGKLFFPFNLITFYPRWNFNSGSLFSYLPVFLLLATLVSLFLARRHSRAPLFLFLFYLLTLSPVLGFVNFYFMTFSFVADRYQYLASASLLFLFSMGAGRLFDLLKKDKSRAFLVFKFLVISFLSILTFFQASLYKNNVALFQHNVKINPKAWAAHNNLGVEYQNQGKFDLAIQHYKTALEINPRFMDAHNNLGILIAQNGQLDDALYHFQTALSIKPNDARTFANLGILYSMKKDYEKAVSSLESSLQIDPSLSSAAFNLALVYIRMGKQDKAAFYLKKTLEIDPSHHGANAKLAELDHSMEHKPKGE